MYFSIRYESNILGPQKKWFTWNQTLTFFQSVNWLMWIPISNKYRCLAAENDKNLFEKYIYIEHLLNMFIKEFLVGVLKWCGGEAYYLAILCIWQNFSYRNIKQMWYNNHLGNKSFLLYCSHLQGTYISSIYLPLTTNHFLYYLNVNS